MKEKVKIELTEEQFGQAKILEARDIYIGDAIDLFFKLQDELKTQGEFILKTRINKVNKEKKELKKEIDELNKQLDILNKLNDDAVELETKQDLFAEYLDTMDEEYNEKVQEFRNKLTWMKDYKLGV